MRNLKPTKPAIGSLHIRGDVPGTGFLLMDGGSIADVSLYPRALALNCFDVDAAAVAAIGALTATGNFSEDETVTIGAIVYTFKASAVDPYEVTIGATADDSITNLANAITNGAGEGTLYGTGTEAHPLVGGVGTTNVLDVTATTAGVAGNAIATLTDAANATWGDDTLTGGSDTTYKMLSQARPGGGGYYAMYVG